MKWRIEYSKEAKKFIDGQDIWSEVRSSIRKFLEKIKGKNINIDLKKLVGDWEGYYRIRIGKVRVIFDIVKENRMIFVEKVDYRGKVYK
ncbi:addiction module toxin RelE [Candidatus Aerophobetes bacterium]|uniref:Addiction module toxin RelE n=1 Tax=Aerophobetes bacterium TaxID=2030807 RepID=A0A523RVY3_UNCAE|nr:MAG: addiction module toxin RelE [Candidatus Aerophobetes bacterium]